MALLHSEDASHDQYSIGFKTVHLLRDQMLGIGSFGAVCKAMCDDLICAAKILHPTLFDPVAQLSTLQRGQGIHSLHRQPSRRFELEYEFLSAIRHPNIVQFLAFFRETGTRLPVILMELMDDNLTNFLENSTQPVPYHIQVNLCHDIAIALSFLHSNKVIHRDLSGNNVLLFGNVRAKVTDFGMARLYDNSNSRDTGQSLTMCPGTDVYMPPEAVESAPVYSEKIDCFSFGVVALQMLTRQFPKPRDRRRKVCLDHPSLPSGTLEVRVPEVDRRQNHIALVDLNHPLLQVTLDCLKDSDQERPSSGDLCKTISALKEGKEYAESLRVDSEIQKVDLTTNERETESLKEMYDEQTQHLEQVTNQLEERELTLAAMKRELFEIDQRLEQEILAKESVFHELKSVTVELELNRKVIVDFQQQFNELKSTQSPRFPQDIPYSQSESNIPSSYRGVNRKSSITLNWGVGENAPVEMCRWCDAVVAGTFVYFKIGYSPKVIAFDSVDKNWFDVVDCRSQGCSLTLVNNLLTTVGGWNSNQLFSLVGDKSHHTKAPPTRLDNDTLHWSNIYPPMPTKRSWASCFSDEAVLIVAGGDGMTEQEKALQTVEVMDIGSLQWSVVAGLPSGVKMASALLCEKHLYLLGGRASDGKSSNMVFKCSLSNLIGSASCYHESTQHKDAVEPHKTGSESRDDGIWCAIASLPCVDCAFVSICGQILAIGGRSRELDREDSYSTAVNLYLPDIDSWEMISSMTLSRSSCFAAALPGNQLMVAGGMMVGDLCTKTVKFASVI